MIMNFPLSMILWHDKWVLSVNHTPCLGNSKLIQSFQEPGIDFTFIERELIRISERRQNSIIFLIIKFIPSLKVRTVSKNFDEIDYTHILSCPVNLPQNIIFKKLGIPYVVWHSWLVDYS